MAVQLMERTALDRLKRILPTDEDPTPMSLPTELFLIAHDDDTGNQHVNEKTLHRGLAAAVLLELWLTKRVRIGWQDNVREGVLTRDPGRITIMNDDATGDRITDTALTLLSQSGGTLRLHDFVQQFADTGLYQRVQADLVAAGIIHHTTRKRFWSFRRRLAYVPTRRAYPVRARGRIRRMLDHYRAGTQRPDPRALALSALVTTLRLTPHLYQRDIDPGHLHHWQKHLLEQQTDPTIRDITATITNYKAPI
ncbi:MAG TPA: GPP34 family phosphoprotein [Micromonosporaceae bacterium]